MQVHVCAHVCVCACVNVRLHHTTHMQRTEDKSLESALSPLLHEFSQLNSGYQVCMASIFIHLTLTTISSHFPPMSCDTTFCPGPWLSPRFPWPSGRLASPCDVHSLATHTGPRPQLYLCEEASLSPGHTLDSPGI